MQKTIIAATLALGLGAAAPASAANIVETAQGAGTFNTLLAAAEAAGRTTATRPEPLASDLPGEPAPADPPASTRDAPSSEETRA